MCGGLKFVPEKDGASYILLQIDGDVELTYGWFLSEIKTNVSGTIGA